ncbi:MAG: bactofilin family protein, partial [Endozoicomonas sp.]
MEPSTIFSNNKVTENQDNAATTLISPETSITGDLHFSGRAHVDGTIHGNIFSEHGRLALTNSATVEGNIHAQNIVIHGTVNGNVYADEFLELISGAVVNGKVFYNVIEVANGARV